MQKINPRCPTIRNKSRKIGRNEACPCGRTKARVIDDPQVYLNDKSDEPMPAVEIQVPMKFKHCCGNMAQKSMTAKAKHNIANAVRSVLGFKKDRRSWLKRVAGFFGRGD